MFCGIWGAAGAADDDDEAEGVGAGLLAALLTRCTVLPDLILYVLRGSSFFMTRPE